jgi:hypothetical protein
MNGHWHLGHWEEGIWRRRTAENSIMRSIFYASAMWCNWSRVGNDEKDREE